MRKAWRSRSPRSAVRGSQRLKADSATWMRENIAPSRAVASASKHRRVVRQTGRSCNRATVSRQRHGASVTSSAAVTSASSSGERSYVEVLPLPHRPGAPQPRRRSRHAAGDRAEPPQERMGAPCRKRRDNTRPQIHGAAAAPAQATPIGPGRGRAASSARRAGWDDDRVVELHPTASAMRFR